MGTLLLSVVVKIVLVEVLVVVVVLLLADVSAACVAVVAVGAGGGVAVGVSPEPQATRSAINRPAVAQVMTNVRTFMLLSIIRNKYTKQGDRGAG
jgi:hypothetical protein